MKNLKLFFTLFFAGAMLASCGNAPEGGDMNMDKAMESTVETDSEFVSVNVDIKNMSQKDIDEMNSIVNVGKGTECVASTNAVLGNAGSSIACKKDARITQDDKDKLHSLLSKYEVKDSELEKLK